MNFAIKNDVGQFPNRAFCKIKVFDMSKPLDVKSGVKALSGDIKLYHDMLAKMEVMTINGCMEQFSIAMSS